MPLGEFLSYALNIEEAAVTPGTHAEGNSNNSKVTNTETTVPRKQGGGNSKKIKKGGGKSSSILDSQGTPTCDFCGKVGHSEIACCIEAYTMTSAKKDTKDKKTKMQNGRKTKLKMLTLLLLQLQLLPRKTTKNLMMMALIKKRLCQDLLSHGQLLRRVRRTK
jgi:hypothetical protein